MIRINTFTSRYFFNLTFSCLIFSCSTQGTQISKKVEPQAERPNIIVIMTDDHAYQAISAYGSDLIQTPAIDRIADEGILMNRAFVTNSICSPSRAVLLTGQYSHLNGVKDNRESFAEGLQFFPAILQQNGYATAVVGKWHINSTPEGFDYWNILPGQGDYYNPRFIKMGKDTAYHGYVTEVTTKLALEWVDNNKDKPFLLVLNQKAPHRNWMPNLKDLELFNDTEFEFPDNFFDDYEGREALKRQKISVEEDLFLDLDSKVICDTCRFSTGEARSRRNYLNALSRLTSDQRKIWDEAYDKEHEEFANLTSSDDRIKWQFQRYMEDYLRCVKSVDDNIARVLEYLEQNDLDDNTIIVYTSDQGFFLGEHGLYDKRFMYNESFRTPLMIRYPNKIPAGQKINDMVLNLDIAPTLLDYAGAEIPTQMQGMSMKKLLEGDKEHPWRDEVYYHYYGKSYGLTSHYGIRTERYKLIHFYDPIDSWELYDLQEDPQEMKNLYNDPQQKDRIIQLKNKLQELQKIYKDDSFL